MLEKKSSKIKSQAKIFSFAEKDFRWVCSEIKELFFDLMFPVFCQSCFKYGEVICEECFDSLFFGEPREMSFNELLNVERLFCLSSMENKILARLIHLFKYQYVEDIGKKIGKRAGSLLKESLKKRRIEPRSVVLVPVPIHDGKKRFRGYNQCEVLVEAMASRGDFETGIDWLVKIKKTPAQMSLTRKQRLGNLKDSFRLGFHEPDRDKLIILVDDVVTTGATLSECALVLRKAGYKRIWGWVVAG